MKTVSEIRLQWINLYKNTDDAGYVCRRYGISRPTLRKWYKSYLQFGLQGLVDQSKKPHVSPNKKINDQINQWILDLRNKRNLGARRIQSELLRHHQCALSLATIHKVLIHEQVKPIVKLKRKKVFKRYQSPIPGMRVQIDTCKISPGIYQYTAVDDCTRWRVIEIYKRRTANNTLNFIDILLEEFPFPIQRIQSDRGTEFFAYRVQEKLKEYCIKFRPTKPASPHLNGKVERSQGTDLQEFYSIADLSNFDILKERLKEWQFYYNWHCPHGSLNGKTPIQYNCELSDKTPFWDEVIKNYELKEEPLQIQNYYIEMQLRKLKPCL